jgi:5-methylthioadenosine/S-adenosylhomocysteine deaminase
VADRTLYTADYVVPMDAAHRVITNGALLVEGNRIVAVGPAADLEPAAAATPGTTVRALRARLLMPGLINTHLHSGLLRGTAEQLPVWEWLRVHIDPMHRVLRPDEAEAAAWLCYAESILSGTTTVVDMWRYLDGAVRAATQLGNRLVTVNYTGAHPDHDYFDTPDDNERLLRTAHQTAGGRIDVWVGLEHPFYADAAGLRRLIAMARDYDTGIYTHCSESDIEPPEFERRYSRRPMFALEDLGFFTAPKAMIAHGVWLDSAEIQLLAQRRAGVAHNPVSNMKLASGMAPVEEYLAAGVNVGIGTDGEKENNNLDLFEDMKTASLLAKLRAMDAAALDSWQVLRMATLGGAAALRLDEQIGSLEPGKKADFIAVRTDTPRMTPLLGDGPYANLHHNLVHAVRGGDVDLVVIDGVVAADGGRLCNADLAELIDRARAAVPGLFARRAEYLAAHDGSLPAVFSAEPQDNIPERGVAPRD